MWSHVLTYLDISPQALLYCRDAWVRYKHCSIHNLDRSKIALPLQSLYHRRGGPWPSWFRISSTKCFSREGPSRSRLVPPSDSGGLPWRSVWTPLWTPLTSLCQRGCWRSWKIISSSNLKSGQRMMLALRVKYACLPGMSARYGII